MSVVEQLGDLSGRWTRGRDLVAAVEVQAHVEGHEVTLRVGLGDGFPGELPHVFVRDPEPLGFIPHLEESTGWVCYQSREGLSVTLNDPLRVLGTALRFALDVLADGIAGRNRKDVAAEIEAYWRDFARVWVPSYVVPDDHVRIIEAHCAGGRLQFLADSFEQVQKADPDARRGAQVRWAPYIPLGRAATDAIGDPRVFRQPGALRAFVEEHIDPTSGRDLLSRLRTRHYPLVVLGLERTEGLRSLVAIRFPRARAHPLGSRYDGGAGELVSLSRRDEPALAARRSSDRKLTEMRVAIIGCGALGGYVAVMLGRAGIGTLLLVDPDIHRFENASRHVLGAARVGKPKVAAIEEHLRSTVPYLRVEPHEMYARPAIAAEHLDKAHLVVVATDSITENRLLNRLLHADNVPAIFTWLEPLGIGGHALLSYGGTGCYECLFLDERGQERLTARSDFAAAGQLFARDATGCAGTFTPFGDLDARETALLASRLTLETLLDRETRSTLRSWRGDPSEFCSAGYSLSARFEQTPQQLAGSQHAFAHPRCPVCAGQT